MRLVLEELHFMKRFFIFSSIFFFSCAVSMSKYPGDWVIDVRPDDEELAELEANFQQQKVEERQQKEIMQLYGSQTSAEEAAVNQRVLLANRLSYMLWPLHTQDYLGEAWLPDTQERQTGPRQDKESNSFQSQDCQQPVQSVERGYIICYAQLIYYPQGLSQVQQPRRSKRLYPDSSSYNKHKAKEPLP